MAQQNQAAKSAIILVLIAILSKTLGFIRDQAIAYRFGASYLTDAYYVAAIIPLMLFSSVNSALNSTIIPVFVEYLQKEGKKEAFRFATNLFNVVAVIMIILVIFGYFLAPTLVKFVAPGFSGKTYQVAVDLSKMLMIIILFLGTAGIANGILNSFKKFTIPAITGLPQNIIIIIIILILGEALGIKGLALGTILGTASLLFLQVPALKKQGMSWSFLFEIGHPGLKKVGLLVIPVFLGSAVNQINIIVDRMLASGLPEGSISALNFASRLCGLPIGLFTSAIATVLFPTLAEYAAKKDMSGLKETLLKGIRIIFFLTIPMTIGLIILREPIIQLLFQRGAFDMDDTRATAYAMQFYALGMVAISLRLLMINVYTSLQNTTLPIITGVLGLTINIILNLIFIRYLAHGGLALATSVSAVINVSILFIFLPRKIGGMSYFRQLGGYLAKIIISAGIMGGCIYLGDYLYPNPQQATLLFQLFKLGGLIIFGAALYFFMAYLLKVDELLWLQRILASKVYRTKVYQVNFFPVSEEIPKIKTKVSLTFLEVNEKALEELPNLLPKEINRFKQYLAAGQRGFFAVYQGKVIHHSWVIINSDLIPLDIGRMQIPPGAALIHCCITSEDFRGMGIFPWVLTEILSTLKEDHSSVLSGVYIDTETINHSSSRSIAKVGFQPYAIIRERFLLGSRKFTIQLLEGGKENGH